MKQEPVLIRKIWQHDMHHFKVEWSDGVTNCYRLSDLQRRCPCAGCVELRQKSANSATKGHVDENIRCINLSSVGRYALRIQFTSGCSNGIYSYDMLRALSKNFATCEQGDCQ